jgi:D-Tyr-tRNAtyr deacylase
MADSVAGEAFICKCCKEEKPSFMMGEDKHLGRPVCDDCAKELKWAEAWLKKGGFSRVVQASDVNHQNYKRFVVP